MDELRGELQKRFGDKEGLRLFNTILPGILGDFRKMLKNEAVGKSISEEYRLEDGSGVIVMKGCRMADGSISVEGHLV